MGSLKQENHIQRVRIFLDNSTGNHFAFHISSHLHGNKESLFSCEELLNDKASFSTQCLCLMQIEISRVLALIFSTQEVCGVFGVLVRARMGRNSKALALATAPLWNATRQLSPSLRRVRQADNSVHHVDLREMQRRNRLSARPTCVTAVVRHIFRHNTGAVAMTEHTTTSCCCEAG